MPGMIKVKGSIPSDGAACLGVSKPTRDRIRQLAQKAKMPISDYIKKLAEAAERKRPVSAIEKAVIVEQLVNENERLNALNEAYKAGLKDYERLFSWCYKNVWRATEPWDKDIRGIFKAAEASMAQARFLITD